MHRSELEHKITAAVLMVSDNQRYQRRLMMVSILISIQIALANLINTTIFTNPVFKCGDVITKESVACLSLEECSVENDYTGTYQAGLICENSSTRMNIQALFTPGLIMGMFVFSLLCDLKGRRFSILLLMVTLTISQILLFFGIFYKIFWLVGFAQFLSGFSSTSGLNINFTIAA